MNPSPDQIRAYDSSPAGAVLFIEDLRIQTQAGVVRFGSIMADYQREAITALAPAVWRLSHGQTTVADAIILKLWIEWTKGGGKDTILAAMVLYFAIFSRNPLVIQIAAADQSQADELRKAAKTWLFHNPWIGDCAEIQNWRILGKQSGVDAQILAADTTGSHGARPDVLIINELSHVAKLEFVENLMDNATKVPHCLVIVATNAGYQGTLAWKWRQIAMTSPQWKLLQYAQPAPQISAANIEEAKLRNTATRFLRLFYGQWPTGGGDALDPQLVDDAVQPGLLPMPGRSPGYAFCGGLDLGYRADPSAFTVIAKKSGSQQLQLARCQSWAPTTKDVDLTEVEEAVYRAHQDYGLQSVSFDPHQAALMSQRLIRRGVHMIPVPFVGEKLNLMAVTLLEVFRSRLITLYDDKQLISDLKKLMIVDRNFGFKLEAIRTEGNHADTAIALVLSLLGTKSLSLSAGGGWGMIKTMGMARGREFFGVPGHPSSLGHSTDFRHVRR